MPHSKTKIQDHDNNKISNNNPRFPQLSSCYAPRNRSRVKESWKQKSPTRSRFREADPLTSENFGRRLSELKILHVGDNAGEIAEHWRIRNSKTLRKEENEEKEEKWKCVRGRAWASQDRVWFLAQRTYGEEEKMNLKETAFFWLCFFALPT